MPQTCGAMPHLLRNIHSIICVFEKYAKDDGDCSALSKGELKQLIQKEFAEVIVDPYDPKTVETVLHLLDTDCDGKVGFEEFTVLLFKVVKACYKKVQECQVPADGPSQKHNISTQQQEIQPPQVSPCPCQKLLPPKEVLDAEELSQGQEKEKPTLEVSCDQPGKEQLQQEEASAYPRTQTSRVQSIQKTIEELIRGNPTCQTSQVEMRTEQGPAQEHQHAVPPKNRCLQEPLSPDQEPSQDVLQNVTQQSFQQRQVEERCNTRQKEETSQTLVQERQTQQSALTMEQIPTGKVIHEPLQETLQGPFGGMNQQVQVEEKRSASGHIRNPQVVQICDQEFNSVMQGQHQIGQQRRQAQGVEQSSVVQQDQEVQVLGQVISGPQEHQTLTPQVYKCHQEEERKPPTLGQSEYGLSEHRALPQEVIKPQVAERCPHCESAETTVAQGSQDSSARWPFQTSRSQLRQKPLQFPPPWSTKQ